MKSLIYPFLTLLLISFHSIGQVTLYSEDFSNASLDNKGQNGATFDVAGVTNWSVDMTGSVTMSGTDHFMQTNGYFESKNTDAPSSNPVEWYSLPTNINSYSNVTVSVDFTRTSSNSGSGMQAFYQVDALGWVPFGSLTGSGAPGTFTANGLSGNSIQIRIDHWGTSSTPSYQHDNVTIVGTPAPCGASTAPTGLTLTPTATTMDISWTDPTTGDGVIVLLREASNAASPPLIYTTYTGNLNFMSGDQIGTSSNYVLYSGNLTTNSITATGLSPGVDYSVDIYSLESTDPCYFSTPLSGNATTPCGGYAPASGPAYFRTCAADFGASTSALSFDIDVAGTYVGTALDATNGPNLRTVRIKLNGAATSDIDQYTATVTAPDGTTSMLVFGSGSFDNNVAALDASFRDNNLLRLASYSTYITGAGGAREPYDQGYYLIEEATGFNVFDGINPQGTWTINFTTSGSHTYTLDFVELEFATPFPIETDVTALGDDCADAIPLSNGIYHGSTIGKTPEATDPKDNVSGCDGITGCGCWNGTKNNSQWFTFFATKPEVEVSISGIEYDAISPRKLQAVMLEANPTACSGESNWTVRSCPETSDGGNSYVGSSGTDANIDLSFTAVVGQQYYFIIDGSAGALGNYVIYADGVLPTTPLPISLTMFEAVKGKNEVNIIWQTVSEINNEVFEIEKSTDGENFTTIKTVAGSGNSTSTIDYKTEDFYPVNGYNYYRLKQIDFDGQYEYSKVSVVDFKLSNIHLFPSMLEQGEIFNLNGVLENTSVMIYSTNGQLVESMTLGNENNAIQANYPKGIYIIKLIEGERMTNKKLVIR